MIINVFGTLLIWYLGSRWAKSGGISLGYTSEYTVAIISLSLERESTTLFASLSQTVHKQHDTNSMLLRSMSLLSPVNVEHVTARRPAPPDTEAVPKSLSLSLSLSVMRLDSRTSERAGTAQ